MRNAPSIDLTREEKDELSKTALRQTAATRDTLRARIILLAAEGLKNQEIAKTLGTSGNTVGKWRRRFVEKGIRGLDDDPRPGRRRIYGPEKIEEIVKKTIEEKPEDRTHWSTRSMAKAVGVGKTTVEKVWNTHRLKPHLEKTFKLSHDKHFTAKLKDVIGLYMNPPEKALVLSVDEKSQIQALDRSQPGLPLKQGRNGTRTHDYIRHGTCCLFAALNVLTGEVLARCEKRHRHQEYLRFLRLIDKTTSKQLEVHLILDNYSTHKHAKVKEWLKKHPRFHLHFIPTSASWLNMVERFFAKITDERIRRGVFKSTLQLTEAIHSYLETHNRNAKPFVWTKTADEIINKLKPVYQMTNNTMY